MRLLLIDAAMGVLLLAAITGAAMGANRRKQSSSRKALGWILVCLPLPLAVGLHLTARLPETSDQAAFLVGVAAFAIGAALILRSGGDDDFRHERDEEPPPWWPDFEREFQEYALESRAHRGKQLVRT